jgi:hypothetical protein
LVLQFVALAVAVMLALPVAAPAPVMTPARRAAEAAFLRNVNRDQSADEMTDDVPRHTGERVAYTCSIDEIVRPGVVVGQCGPEDEPVDLYLELPPGRWRTGQVLRVLGIIDRPGSWSDVSGHTVYYPFVKAVFVDRIR